MVELLFFLKDYSINILTVFLVLITAYYAWQTKKMVKEMGIARRHQFIPALRIEPTRLYIGDSFDVKIVNIGLGPAKNIKGKIRLEPNGDEIEITYPTLYPQKRFALQSPFKDAESYQDIKKFKQLVLSATYADITNNTYDEGDIFYLGDLDKIRNDDYTRDEVSDKLGDIGRKLDNISRAIEHLGR